MFRGDSTLVRSKEFKKGLQDQTVTKDRRKQYMKDEHLKSGKQFESFVVRILWEAEEVDEVLEVPTGYAVDTQLKIDVGYTLKGNSETVYGLQVKSTPEQAEKHLSLEKVVYNGKQYPVPGVVYREPGESDWSVVTTLLEGLGLTLKKDLADKLTLVHQAGWTGKWLSLSLVNPVLGPGVVTRLRALGACTTRTGPTGPEVQFPPLP